MLNLDNYSADFLVTGWKPITSLNNNLTYPLEGRRAGYFILSLMPKQWTLQSARTIQHLHNSEVEEVLEDTQTQLPITQQHWPPLINEHIFRQLLLQMQR